MDADARLREAAFEHLDGLCQASGNVLELGQLEAGFRFEGRTIPLLSRRRGIWRPSGFGRAAPALSIVTVPQRPGREAPYDDEIRGDGWFAYRYRGTDPQHWDNQAVRQAMQLRRPLIYFYGVAPGRYLPIYPAMVLADDPSNLTFYVSADVRTGMDYLIGADPAQFEARRAYATVAVKKRLHQERFRELVMQAYGTRCAVCRLRHGELLDAAHILPDRDERGRPEVPNGLALCKIHHSAFDVHILGITPDYLIRIRHDVLEEHDGPMLQHGLKEMDGGRLIVPRRPELHPNRDYLAERYELFQAA